MSTATVARKPRNVKPRNRKSPQPVHGTCRWVRRPELPNGIGTLTINGVEYDLEAHLNGDRPSAPLVISAATLRNCAKAAKRTWTAWPLRPATNHRPRGRGSARPCPQEGTTMRDSKGRFLPGPDPDRHLLTKEEKRKGF